MRSSTIPNSSFPVIGFSTLFEKEYYGWGLFQSPDSIGMIVDGGGSGASKGIQVRKDDMGTELIYG